MDELQNIQNLIYEVRGVKVMLDKDLAGLYHVTTGNLNKAVKRNAKRFPPDFMFQLNNEEFQKLKENLIFQNGISNPSASFNQKKMMIRNIKIFVFILFIVYSILIIIFALVNNIKEVE